jgi:hypothetical protein
LLAGIPRHVTDGVLQQAHEWFALPVSHAQQLPGSADMLAAYFDRVSPAGNEAK